eukprot:TRINITY_DN7049_c0_g1_i1.p1 TRINITY_DN7049_c0_g1~~TRINITY_DN7049_c0_g1_i1.p1  ORF type:complete len:282 (-),score=47.11 TRINITY_DN7049_c0_g1_i1:63-815(-)
MCIRDRGGLYFKNSEGHGKKEADGGILAGIMLARHPWILMGYIISFIAVGETFLSASTIIMWTKKHYVVEVEGSLQATHIMAVVFGMVFITGGITGYITDHMSLFTNVGLTCLLSFLGMSTIIFVNNPEHPITYLGLVLWGTSLAGLGALSTYLVDRFTPEEHRGKAHAIQGIASVVGIIFCSHLGGFLFDHWTIHAPFILFLAALAITLVFLLIIWLTRSTWLAKYESEGSFLLNIHSNSSIDKSKLLS